LAGVLADYCLIDVHEIERIGRVFADCCLIDVPEIERIDRGFGRLLSY